MIALWNSCACQNYALGLVFSHSLEGWTILHCSRTMLF